jgi:hypothetical protein
MVYGDAYFIDREGCITGKYFTEPFKLHRLADVCFICQPTVFLRCDIIEKIGMLNTNLQTCMDFDYWIRIGKTFDSTKVAYLRDEFLATSRMYEENKTLGMRKIVYTEIFETVQSHFGYISDTWMCGYIKEIILGKKLRRYEKANPISKSFLHFYFILRLFTERSGWIYFRKYLRDIYKLLNGIYFESYRGTTHRDG